MGSRTYDAITTHRKTQNYPVKVRCCYGIDHGAIIIVRCPPMRGQYLYVSGPMRVVHSDPSPGSRHHPALLLPQLWAPAGAAGPLEALEAGQEGGGRVQHEDGPDWLSDQQGAARSRAEFYSLHSWDRGLWRQELLHPQQSCAIKNQLGHRQRVFLLAPGWFFRA